MKVPVIKVNGRIVGTNSHDCLYIKNNAIHYLNVQCMGSSEEYPEEIKFDCEEPDEYSFSAYPNAITHAIVDNLKANLKKINLIQDQLIHIGQILITFIAYMESV